MPERWMTHAICDPCWNDWQPGREPHRLQVIKREGEICCWCGQHTDSGIYAREDQNKLQHCTGAR